MTRWAGVALFGLLPGAIAKPGPVLYVELPEPRGAFIYDAREVRMSVRQDGRFTAVIFERAIFLDDFED